MAEDDSNKGKSPKTSVFVTVLIALVAVAVIVMTSRDRGEGPEIPAPPEKPSAAQQTQALVNERMNDRPYREALSKAQAEQADIARKSMALQEEIARWIDANEKAAALSRKIATLTGDATAEPAEIESVRKELEALMQADPEGKRLQSRQEDLKAALEAAHQKTADIIGAKIRSQTAPKSQAGEAR